MIEKIIGATIVPDLQALDLADQIGWLVKPWTKRVQTGDGQFSDLIIPVAANVTNESCEVQDYGLNVLTTDKSMDILIHISADGDMISETNENIPQRKAINIEQDIRISVWMNQHQGRAHLLKAAIMKAFFKAQYNHQAITWTVNGTTDPAYNLYLNKLKVRFVREMVTNPFEQYTFARDQAQHANNYASFGMVFKLTGIVFPDCAPAYPDIPVDECGVVDNTFTVTIVEQDGKEGVCIGGELVLEGTVTGGIGVATYQWYELIDDVWTEIEGATSVNYSHETQDPEGDRSYQLWVTKLGETVVSNILPIHFAELPNAYLSATPSTIDTNGSSTLLAEVIGGYGYNNHQWQYFTEGDWQDIEGATDIEYMVDGSQYGVGEHLFRVHVIQGSDTCEVFSTLISLPITAP